MIETLLDWLVPLSYLMLVTYFVTRMKYRNIEWDNYAVFMILPSFVTIALVLIACFMSSSPCIDLDAEREKARQYAVASGFTVPSSSVLSMAEKSVGERRYLYRKEKDFATGLWLASYEDVLGRPMLDIIGSDGYTLLLCGCVDKRMMTEVRGAR